MKWSWKITRFAGIDIYVHATFFILIAWIALRYWQTEGTIAAVINGVGFILALFTCVVLHEFGHALTARRYGIRTRHITLLPIGGVAALEKMPDDPKQEVLVALAGPMVNIAIAMLLWFWIALGGRFMPVEELGLTGGSFVEKLLAINIILAVFNLLPAFPMDGGRVLRALLAMRMNHLKATSIAANVGQSFALLLGFIGLLYNPFLVFIALFVWIGAAAEVGAEQMKSSLSTLTVGDATLTEFHTVLPDEPLSRAIALTLAGSQKDFPVVVENEIVGVLTQSDMLKGLHAAGDAAAVGDWMHRDVPHAESREPLEDVVDRLRECPCRMLAVTSAGRLEGIVNLDNFAELVQIQLARRAP